MDDAPEARPLKLKPKEFERVNEPKGHETQPPIDVYQALNENVCSNQAVEEPIDFDVRPSRRKKDYIRSMILGNGFFLGATALFWGNPVAMLFGIAGACIWSGGLTWIMWFIMDDYD